MVWVFRVLILTMVSMPPMILVVMVAVMVVVVVAASSKPPMMGHFLTLPGAAPVAQPTP